MVSVKEKQKRKQQSTKLSKNDNNAKVDKKMISKTTKNITISPFTSSTYHCQLI